MLIVFDLFIQNVPGQVLFENFSVPCVEWGQMLVGNTLSSALPAPVPTDAWELSYTEPVLDSPYRLLQNLAMGLTRHQVSHEYFISNISFNSHNHLCEVGNGFNYYCILLMKKLTLYGVKQITQSQATGKQ